MTRKILSLAAPLVAVAAFAPAAGATQLHSAPTLRHIDGGRIQLQFTTDKKLAVSKTKISVNGDRVAFLKAAGRHGKDYRYTALAAVGGLQDGHKYKVRFRFPDGDSAVRLSKLL
jgi:hypothetical protein